MVKNRHFSQNLRFFRRFWPPKSNFLNLKLVYNQTEWAMDWASPIIRCPLRRFSFKKKRLCKTFFIKKRFLLKNQKNSNFFRKSPHFAPKWSPDAKTIWARTQNNAKIAKNWLKGVIFRKKILKILKKFKNSKIYPLLVNFLRFLRYFECGLIWFWRLGTI